MKPITINVSEPVYRDFRNYGKALDRTTSELIREAMEEYRRRYIKEQTSLGEIRPSSVGEVIQELSKADDLLGEMLDD